jgi:glycosyltransferase involved in cell wall biosynthesis
VSSEHVVQAKQGRSNRDSPASLVRYSVVIPVYGNEPTIPALIEQLGALAGWLDHSLEAVFVVDGSPDGSLPLLRRLLAEETRFEAQLIALSRNFGSFSAIRAGLAAADGDFVAIMAADLQEPIELVRDFFAALSAGEHDVAVGVRATRSDPPLTVFASRLFWTLARRLGQPELPSGGADVFACTRQVASHLIRLEESHSSLIGLLYWVGFRRIEVPYERRLRTEGKSGWRLRRKLRYLLDSLFSFTDIPIMAITAIGMIGVVVSLVVALAVFVAWLTSDAEVAGYTPIMLAIVFTASGVLVSLGVIGSFVWRTYENTKGRPGAIPMTHERFDSTRT